jgi:transposase-like protein
VGWEHGDGEGFAKYWMRVLSEIKNRSTQDFLQFDTEIRTIICTTNAIESINARIWRAVNFRRHFPPSKRH